MATADGRAGNDAAVPPRQLAIARSGVGPEASALPSRRASDAPMHNPAAVPATSAGASDPGAQTGHRREQVSDRGERNLKCLVRRTPCTG